MERQVLNIFHYFSFLHRPKLLIIWELMLYLCVLVFVEMVPIEKDAASKLSKKLQGEAKKEGLSHLPSDETVHIEL